MRNFTVLGLDESTGQAHRGIVWAKDAHDAMRRAALSAYNPDSLCIIGAIEGAHTLYTPGEDNRASAYACDLAEAGDDTVLRDIASESFRVLVGSGAGAGTFIIERISDKATSLRYTGTDALDEFAKMEAALQADPFQFDAMCASGLFFDDDGQEV